MSLSDQCKVVIDTLEKAIEHLDRFNDGKGVAGAAVKARTELSAVGKLVTVLRRDIQAARPAPKKRIAKVDVKDESTSIAVDEKKAIDAMVDEQRSREAMLEVKEDDFSKAIAEALKVSFDVEEKKDVEVPARSKSPVKKPRKKRVTKAVAGRSVVA